MAQGFEIIFFAAVAGYVFFRLWSVLGQTTIEKKPTHLRCVNPTQCDDVSQAETVLTIPPAILGNEDLLLDKAQQGLQKLLIRQPAFDMGRFLNGAKAAFVMIVKAFAEGDRETLKRLISEEVYKPFNKAIAQREKSNQRQESRVDSVRIEKIEDVVLDDAEVTITLRFQSEQMMATLNPEGEIMDNPARLSIPVTDIWSFRRRLDTKDPNWLLVATRTDSSSEAT